MTTTLRPDAYADRAHDPDQHEEITANMLAILPHDPQNPLARLIVSTTPQTEITLPDGTTRLAPDRPPPFDTLRWLARFLRDRALASLKKRPSAFLLARGVRL